MESGDGAVRRGSGGYCDGDTDRESEVRGVLSAGRRGGEEQQVGAGERNFNRPVRRTSMSKLSVGHEYEKL